MATLKFPPLVMFDLDKTLARSKEPLAPSMAKLFAQLSTKTKVAVISGGKLEQLEDQVIGQLPPLATLENIYLLPTSGAGLFTYEDRKWTKVYEEELTSDEADTIEDAITEAVAKTKIVNLESKSYGERIEFRGAEVSFSALGQEAPIDEKEAWDPENVKRPKLRDAVAKLLPEYDVKVGGSSTIDVTKKGVNKAFGVTKLAEYLELPVDEMLYVGDALFPGGNDEVVKQTEIKTHAVCDPNETEILIRSLLGENVPASTPGGVTASTSRSGPTEGEIEAHIKKNIKGDVDCKASELAKYSKDTSLFTRMPSLVVYPKDAADVSALVKVVSEAKKKGSNVSVTGRSAGTDMSGGPLTTSIVAVFMKYMNNVIEITTDGDGGHAVTEPGVFYRDFEKATLAKKNKGDGLILPSYPASRELCAMGGIVNNNSGGERTLEYGKTEDYIEEVEVVLSDGSITTFKALNQTELAEKQKLETLEGDIYRRMSKLLNENSEVIANAKPKVSKNSAGYALWNVIDTQTGKFNLAKLICGAQGTLALMTKAKLRLVREEGHRAMLVIFVSDINVLPKIVHKVLPFNPESFESYDDNTFKLAVRFLPQMLSQMGFWRAARLGLSFLPEVAMTVTGGIPKLVLMAEFSADTPAEALKRAEDAQKEIYALQLPHLQMSVKANEHQSEKYWIVRRESFALLRKSVNGLYAAPFIDDFVVPPDSYPQFLPELNALLAKYEKNFIYTVAGHIGNGNFHIIPLMDLKKPETRRVILELSPKVYELVIKYGGTTTGEHNDGIIRTPYLEMLFGKKVTDLFAETKHIFDPLTIFNPGKKVGGTFADIEHDMLKTS
jgi:HAD superfamily hydrolase (TIGR01484 family)